MRAILCVAGLLSESSLCIGAGQRLFPIAFVEQWNSAPVAAIRKANGHWQCRGGLGVGQISVEPHMAATDIQILIHDAKKHRYWLYLKDRSGHWYAINKKNTKAQKAWERLQMKREGAIYRKHNGQKE